MKISKAAFITAWENQKLVRGALKAVNVRLDYTNYDDLLQEGILVYAQMLSTSSKSRQEIDRLSFRKIMWHTLDLLRKDQCISEHQEELVSQENVQLTNWDNQLILAGEVVCMSQLEQLIFFDNLLGTQTVTSLAKQTGRTRVQVSRVKRKLLNRLRQVLTK
ncbi:sigma-70 family RNA polymerase sigma factor [Lactobacillus sp. ESL0681]|uniref:sigma-70 family RNA polymerase sigma factor n=1 Tax=Lactobacillus sp. ESL0681 TaxID=2983211 RepID=UPI0023F81BE9|nr:sigma-70 family RNA polymerase sigma factor [Lactobacillus sp. ESL0681]WEV39964.1 sigma-70 family RNA polymerase sigma factor [Lactobacillus sp. ESL0681]